MMKNETTNNLLLLNGPYKWWVFYLHCCYVDTGGSWDNGWNFMPCLEQTVDMNDTTNPINKNYTSQMMNTDTTSVSIVVTSL